MADATCREGGHATTDKLKRGLCGKHYRAWWRANREPLLDPHRLGSCTRGCGRPVRAKDLCGPCLSNDWYHANADKAKATQAANRARNRVRDRARARAWRAANPDRAVENCRHWYAANRAAMLEYRRAYRKRNREAIRLLNAGRRARQRNAPVNDLTARQWHAIKAAYGHRCAYCRQRRNLTMDHVVPLSKGGSHTAANIVPACGPCNSSKHTGPAPTYQPLLV